MDHVVPLRSELENKILLALLKNDETGLTRLEIARLITQNSVPEAASKLRALAQIGLASETFSMVLDDTDPDDVAVWFISDSGKEYLLNHGLA
jgi:hypothetical protein